MVAFFQHVAVVCLVLLMVVPIIRCKPTHCHVWASDAWFLCAKDNYKADSILIRNIAQFPVSFRVDKWIFRCGGPKDGPRTNTYSLDIGKYITLPFGEARDGYCKEFIVLSCTNGFEGYKCPDVISVAPLVQVDDNVK
jgi:hypothetical protein